KPRLEPLGKAEQQVLLRALAKNPDDRYPDCLTFVNALQKAVARELPEETTALPAVPGSPTAADAGQNTIAPAAGAPARETFTSPPAAAGHFDEAAPQKRESSWLKGLLAALVVAALLAFPAWLLLQPSPAQGELTLLPLEPQALRPGQTVTIAVTIQRSRF